MYMGVSILRGSPTQGIKKNSTTNKHAAMLRNCRHSALKCRHNNQQQPCGNLECNYAQPAVTTVHTRIAKIMKYRNDCAQGNLQKLAPPWWVFVYVESS